MSGYPGAGYPGAGAPPGAPGAGYPGAGAPPGGAGYPGQPGGGYPGQQPGQGAPGGGYPGASAPGAPGGYPGAGQGAPGGGYPAGGYPHPGAAGAPAGAPPGGYPGAAPGAPGGYPGGAPGGYPGQSPQGQQGAYPGAAPTPVDPQVEQWFRAVDQDNSGQIDAKELGQALANGDGSMFSEEACRTMIHMFDTNSTGTIDINEFGRLFAYIQQWKAMFENFDRDRYRFSPQFTQNVLAKLDPRDRKLTLDNFIVVSVQVKRLTDSFRTRDKEMKGQALLGYEDFVGLAIGAHR